MVVLGALLIIPSSILAAGLVCGLVEVLDWLTGWFGDHGPMIAGNRRHRRHLARLERAAIADADHCGALSALSVDDRIWLEERGWIEPPHACFLRINGLDIEDLVARA